MSRLQWDQSSEKVYELGVDRGVIFPPVGEGFVWNGLVSVNETPDGGEFSAYYMDGDPYYIQAQPDNFAATIEAYTYPQGLEPFIGETTGVGGITYTGQTKGSFGLSYRTLIGTGDSGLMEYKIHLVYNAKLSSSEKSYSTTTDSPEPLTFSWDLNAVPVDILGRRDTAHIVVDSRKVSRLALGVFEGYLYGTNGISSRLPSISQIDSFFAQFTNLTVEYPVTYKGSLDTGDPFPAPWTKGDAYTIEGKLSVYNGSNWYSPSSNSLTLF